MSVVYGGESLKDISLVIDCLIGDGNNRAVRNSRPDTFNQIHTKGFISRGEYNGRTSAGHPEQLIEETQCYFSQLLTSSP